jgi:hypothetical protein
MTSSENEVPKGHPSCAAGADALTALLILQPTVARVPLLRSAPVTHPLPQNLGREENDRAADGKQDLVHSLGKEVRNGRLRCRRHRDG